MTRWTLMAAPALLVFTLGQPSARAQPAAPAASGPSYTFQQYQAYRVKSLDRRRQVLAERLADPNLPTDQKAKLQERKAYYDWLAQMPAAERDRRFHRRFDEIDTDHDGTIDPAERAAWREKQRAYYSKLRAEHAAARHP